MSQPRVTVFLLRSASNTTPFRSAAPQTPPQRKFGYRSIVMVGDGATDLEARTPDAAGIFIGYGGVVARPNIAAEADWYVYNIQDLTDALE